MSRPVQFCLPCVLFVAVSIVALPLRAAEGDTTDPSKAQAVPAVPQDRTLSDKALVVNSTETKEPATTIDAAQAKATFQAKFDEYKAAIREIEVLQADFQTANDEKKKQLNQELAGKVAHTQSIVNSMVEAAEAAYRAAPNADPQIVDVLTAVAKYYTIGRQVGRGVPMPGNPSDVFYPTDGGDQYERAMPIIKTLIDGGAPNTELYIWGMLSAFMTNDYDLAKVYYEKAKENGALEEVIRAASREDQRDDQAGLHQSVAHLVSVCANNLDTYKELWAKESAIRAAEAKADDLPRVKLTTSKGEIVVELFENEAPEAVASFLSLVKQGFYNGSPFHRVLPGFMAQGGAKTDDGEGGPGYTIRCECYRPDYRRHFRGTLSMAHAGRDTGSSQFFLTFIPTVHLNGKHTAFGRVIEGMEVLGDLQRRSAMHQGSNAPKADRILKAEVIRDRGHEYRFEKLPGR